MEYFPTHIENSTGHFAGIYIDITNFILNFPDIDQVDKLPPHRFREAIQIILLRIIHRVVSSFPACRTQLLNGPPRKSENLTYPTLLATSAIFHFFAQDTRPTSLGRFARARISKIHLFYIANLFRATYCANFRGRKNPPHIRPTGITSFGGGGGGLSELVTSYGWRIAKQPGERAALTNGG